MIHWVGVNSLIRASPPAPLGDGRGEAPGRGFGGEPNRGRAGVRSAGCGAAAPHACDVETGNRASIRTCSGRGVVGFRVHDLIQCSLWLGKGWDAAILFAHLIGLSIDAHVTPQSSQSRRADAPSQSSRIFEIVSSGENHRGWFKRPGPLPRRARVRSRARVSRA